MYLFVDISKRNEDICNKLQTSVINCRYLQMWIKCENRNVGQCPSWWPPCRIQVAAWRPLFNAADWLTPTTRVPCS